MKGNCWKFLELSTIWYQNTLIVSFYERKLHHFLLALTEFALTGVGLYRESPQTVKVTFPTPVRFAKSTVCGFPPIKSSEDSQTVSESAQPYRKSPIRWPEKLYGLAEIRFPTVRFVRTPCIVVWYLGYMVKPGISARWNPIGVFLIRQFSL